MQPEAAPTQKESGPETTGFQIGQRVVHSGAGVGGDTRRRTGTVKYVGPVEGTSGTWVGVDWDNDGDGKNDGSHNGVRYFEARGPTTASFVRPHNLSSSGITLLEALQLRYRSTSTKKEQGALFNLQVCTLCLKGCTFIICNAL